MADGSDVEGTEGVGGHHDDPPVSDGREEPMDPETREEAIEERYDFEHFSPADMAEMTVEEWEAAFDPETWITGEGLLRRVEAELRSRVARREVFAVLERATIDGEERVLAYTDVGYATVSPDGTVEGEGTILEDVEPVVALCAMADYDVSDPPADAGLPHPDDVAVESGGLGDRLLLAIAGVQILAGLGLLGAALVADLGPGSGLVATVAGLGFLLIGIVVGVLVANARLSGRFRAAEYRERLRAAGVGSGERPDFLPVEDGAETADERPEPTPD